MGTVWQTHFEELSTYGNKKWSRRSRSPTYVNEFERSGYYITYPSLTNTLCFGTRCRVWIPLRKKGVYGGRRRIFCRMLEA